MVLNNNIHIYNNTPPTPPPLIVGPVTGDQNGVPGAGMTISFMPPAPALPAAIVALLTHGTAYTICSGPYIAVANPGLGMNWNAALNQFA
jgi:hypothetical protein